MTTAKRLTAAGLLLAVVLAGLLILRPGPTTYAAWTDEVAVPVPALQTGGLLLEVVPRSAAAATVAMAGEAAGTWRPVEVRVSVDGRDLAGTELSGSRLEYRVTDAGAACPSGAATYTATPSGSQTSFAVTGGDRLEGARTLCVTFVPSDSMRSQYGGRTLSLTTSIDGVSTPATWTAAGSWAAEHAMPAAATVSGPTCTPDHPRVMLSWDWDRGGLGTDVSRWSLQAEVGGDWREVASLDRAQRAVVISPSDFSGQSGTYQVRVVAVLADGTTVPGTTTVGVAVHGTVSCA